MISISRIFLSPINIIWRPFIIDTFSFQVKRVRERHGEGVAADGMLELLMKFQKFYEKPGDGEKNTYNVDINPEMTKKDVLDAVLKVIKDKCWTLPIWSKNVFTNIR